MNPSHSNSPNISSGAQFDYLVNLLTTLPPEDLPPELHMLRNTETLNEKALHLMLKYQSVVLRLYGFTSIKNLGLPLEFPYIHPITFDEPFCFQKETLCFLCYFLHQHYVAFEFEFNWLFDTIKYWQRSISFPRVFYDENYRNFKVFLEWFWPILDWIYFLDTSLHRYRRIADNPYVVVILHRPCILRPRIEVSYKPYLEIWKIYPKKMTFAASSVEANQFRIKDMQSYVFSLNHQVFSHRCANLDHPYSGFPIEYEKQIEIDLEVYENGVNGRLPTPLAQHVLWLSTFIRPTPYNPYWKFPQTVTLSGINGQGVKFDNDLDESLDNTGENLLVDSRYSLRN